MKVFLAGDSTVTEQPRVTPYCYALCFCGWGQMLGRFIRSDVPVRNYAVSGATTLSFRQGEDSPYSRILREAEFGDYALMQFGHNDQKLLELRHDNGYSRELTRYITELGTRGVRPVLVTPVARNSWRGDNGAYNDLLAPYAMAMRGVASRCGVPLIDLHKRSRDCIKALGFHCAKKYFYPGDYTHPNDLGGYKLARLVAKALLDCGEPSAQALREAVLPYEQWLDFDADMLPPDETVGWVLPPRPRTDFGSYRHEGALTRREALEMAREGYGYFVTVHADAAVEAAPYYCAKENGYLPRAFPKPDSDAPVSAALFAELMRLACAGRNRMTREALSLEPQALENGDISAESAISYALELERLATGAIGGGQSDTAERPAGS